MLKDQTLERGSYDKAMKRATREGQGEPALIRPSWPD